MECILSQIIGPSAAIFLRTSPPQKLTQQFFQNFERNVEQERKLYLTVCSHFMPSLDITKKLIETFLALLFNKN